MMATMTSYVVVVRGRCRYAYTYQVEAETIESAVALTQTGMEVEDSELDGHTAESIEVYDEAGKRVLDRTLVREPGHLI